LGQEAQENPDGDEGQEDESPLPRALPELVDRLENDDKSLHVSSSPQDGQINLSSPSEGKINCSKVFPHLLHLNS